MENNKKDCPSNLININENDGDTEELKSYICEELNAHTIPDYKINLLRQVIKETNRIIKNAENNINDAASFPLIDSYEHASIIEANILHLKEISISPNAYTNTTTNKLSFNFTDYEYSDEEDGSSTSSLSSSSSKSSLEQEVISKPKRGRPPKPPPENCSKCGTQNTPEWRRGLDNEGNVIYLCNACGLDYAKQFKKKEIN